MKRSVVLIAVIVCVSAAPVQAREEIKLTTIVPDQSVLRVKKGIVSETNYNPSAFPDASIPAKSLLVEGSVGIGTTNPQGKLDVNGSIAVGGQQGASGQVLTSQGAGNVPVWSNAAGTVNAVQVSNSTLTTAAQSSWVALPGMTLTINTTVPNSKVLISFSSSFKNYNYAGQWVRLMINGSEKFDTLGAGNVVPAVWNVNSFQWIERFPRAGAQTISIEWKNCWVDNCSNTDNLPYVLNAIELR